MDPIKEERIIRGLGVVFLFVTIFVLLYLEYGSFSNFFSSILDWFSNTFGAIGKGIYYVFYYGIFYGIPLLIGVIIVLKVRGIYLEAQHEMNLMIKYNEKCKSTYNNLGGSNIIRGVKFGYHDDGNGYSGQNYYYSWEEFLKYDRVSLWFSFLVYNKKLRELKLELRHIIKDPVQRELSLKKRVEDEERRIMQVKEN